MTDEKRYKITVLADDLHDKRQHYRALGMANTPRDPDEARKSSIAYALARAEMIEAQAALDAAMS